MLDPHSRVHWIIGAAFGSGFLALLACWPSASWSWETAHGPPDNTGFVDVATGLFEAPRTAGGLGDIAPGVGPVIAPDGTVYVVNRQGKLMSFKPDGTPGWSRTIAAGQSVVASPAIGQDGSIYVIGVTVSRDHRGGKTVKRVDSFLHVFNSTGGYLGQTPFPEHNGGGGTTASPNLWRFNNIELVIVPAVYRRETGPGIDIRLLAFSNGGLMFDQRATTIVPEIVTTDEPSPLCLVPIFGTATCLITDAFGFPSSDGSRPRDASVPPFPPVGIFTNPLGGTPFILVSDHFQDLVGFTLSGGQFLEAFRVHDGNRLMRSAPAILPDRHAIIGTEDIDEDFAGTGSGGVVFSGPNLNKAAPVTGLRPIFATPTRLADGRAVLVGGSGQVTVLNGRNVVKQATLPGGSIASPAASRTHLFVSTGSSLYTLDPNTLVVLARVDWSGGGVSPPAIGPTGYVYAIADNTLYISPPGRQLPPSRVIPEATATAVATTGADTKPYKPPLTMNGNRLFACEELDGDDCGNGDYDMIATAFCKKEGFYGAGHIEVESKKVKAETLDGRYCSKKKCKVFEQIICANN